MDELVVIGAGLPRTGTLSLRAALELLLAGPCYHGAVPLVERPDHRPSWLAAARQDRLEEAVEAGVLAGYVAGLDHPFMLWWRELAVAQPSAKVILTVRNPASWAASCVHHFSVILGLPHRPPYSWLLRLLFPDGVRYLREMAGLQVGLAGRLNRAVAAGEAAAVELYRQHEQEVRATVPADRLLVFNVAEGWAPLCSFLHRPVPDLPFPHVNDSRAVLVAYNTVRGLTWAGLLAGAALALWLLLTRGQHSPVSLTTALILATAFILGLRVVLLRVGQKWAQGGTRLPRNQVRV